MTSIRAKIILVAFISLLAAVFTFAAVMVTSLQSHSRDEETIRLRHDVRAFNERSTAREQGVLAVLQAIAVRPDVRKAMAQSDRQALIDLLTPTFNDLQRTLEIAEFYVHGSDGAVLLRVHDPAQRGDSYVSHRPMIVEAVRKQQVTRGIELDSGRMSHRVVIPILDDGALVGLLEIGIDYNKETLGELKQRQGFDSRIWLRLDAVGPSGLWPEGDPLASPIPGMFMYASTYGSQRVLPAAEYENVIRLRAPVISFAPGDGAFAVAAVPIVDHAERAIGILEISQSRDQTIATLRSSLIETILVAAVVAAGGMLVLAFTLSLVVLRPLRGLTRAAHKQLDGDPRRPGPTIQ